jgi:hypothetical protein
MKQIQKQKLSEALLQFRRELQDEPALTSNERIHLMEEFKREFDRTGDYDFAFDHVMQKLVPALSRIKSMEKNAKFTDYWKSMNGKDELSKGFFDIFQNEEGKARKLIDEYFGSGKREIDILNAFIIRATDFYKRPLSQSETDKLRYLVISEKVRLINRGVKITD